MNTAIKAFTMGLLLILVAALVMVPAAACGDSHYMCGPRDFGACPDGQECQCHTEQICGWGDWNNGRCPAFGTCQERSTGHGHWEHRHYTCHDEQVCGCVPVECTNGMGFRVSIPSSPDPTPYNIGTAPATVDFWSNPYPNIEDPFPEGTTFLWDFGDGTTSTEGPNAVYHTYTTPGIYDVTLTVTFPEGCPETVTETKRAYLKVDPVVSGDPGYRSWTGAWGDFSTCDGTLEKPGKDPISLMVRPGALLQVKAENLYNGDQGLGYVDGLRVVWRAGDEGIYDPTCTFRVYTGACNWASADGFTPTVEVNGPVQQIKVKACKDESTTYEASRIRITILDTGDGGIVYQGYGDVGDQCTERDFTLTETCSGCIKKPALYSLWRIGHIAPSFSGIVSSCPAPIEAI